MTVQTSFHERNRAWLESLADHRLLLRSTPYAERTGWKRLWGRVVDGTPPAARMLLGSDCGLLVTVDVTMGRSVTVTEFPTDAGLPGLGEVLDRHQGAVVERYRPSKRCTLRLAAGGGFLKVFAKADVERMHRDGSALFRAARRGDVAFAVARSIAFDLRHGTHAQGLVPGAPIADRLMSSEGPRLARRMGAACATLPLSGVAPSLACPAEVELARTVRRIGEVALLCPALEPRLAGLCSELHDLHARFSERPLMAIHGSPHPTQWLESGDQLGLVDFDRFCLGDPELDVATFSGEVDFEAGPSVDEVNRAFLVGYESVFGSLDPLRLVAYRVHKRFAKVHRTARSLRPDADLRCHRHLDAATAALSLDPVS